MLRRMGNVLDMKTAILIHRLNWTKKRFKIVYHKTERLCAVIKLSDLKITLFSAVMISLMMVWTARLNNRINFCQLAGTSQNSR